MCLKAIGFDDTEAEQARRVFAKKKHKEVAEQIEIIKKKLQERNLPKEAGDVVIKLAEDGANYQFNFSHSLATSYLTALTTYLKYKYPLEFYTACLNSIIEFRLTEPMERISQIQEELKYFNIKLAAPDLLNSHINFTKDKKNNEILFGLGGIKGISTKTLEKLQDFKHEYSTKLQIFESAQQCGINIASLSVLIQAGAMDKYLRGSTRTKLNLEAQTYSLLTDREKKKVHELGDKFNYDLFNILRYLKTVTGENGKPFIKESRICTIRKKHDKYKKIYNQNSKHEKLTNYFYEKSCLGFSYSHTLSSILRETYPEIMDVGVIKSLLNEDKVFICGEIQEVNYGIARSEKKTKYVKLKVSDSTGSIDCMMFNYKDRNGDTIEQIERSEIQNGGKFEKDWLVVVEGKKKSDSVFCSKIIKQEALIYTKLSELKNDKPEKEEIS
jgi:DNA polymerase III alpha subunit